MNEVAQPREKQSLLHDFADIFMELPRVVRSIIAAGTLIGIGMSAQALFTSISGIPQRVKDLEAAESTYAKQNIPARIVAIEKDMPGLHYLVCKSLEQEKQRDGGACRYFLRNNPSQFSPPADTSGAVTP